MSKSPLLDKLQNGGTALGLYVNSPDMVELCAYLGFDYFIIDQMFSGLDWAKTEERIRTGEAAGITPVVRIQSNPWNGFDPRLAVDVTRALGVGAQFVTTSVSNFAEAKQCLAAGEDWHRKVMIVHYYKDYDEWSTKQEARSKETFVMPLIESEDALAQLDDIITMPGVKVVRIAMTDSSRILNGTQAPDWYLPALWERFDRAVALGRKHGVLIGGNTSYAYTLEELQRRITKLHEHGARMILVQGANFLFQVAMNDFLKPLRHILRPGI